MIKVLVCGGRNFGKIPQGSGPGWGGADRNHPDYRAREAEYFFVRTILHKLAVEKDCYHVDEKAGGDWFEGIRLISGMADGADKAAVDWAIVNYIPFDDYSADWKTHGKAAGPIRNKQMLKEGKPDLVVAFPGNKGTANMIKLAKEAGIEVREIQYEEKT